MKKRLFLTLFAFMMPNAGVQAQTIAEKKAGTAKTSVDLSKEMQQYLVQVNKEIRERRFELQRLHKNVQALYDENALDSAYQQLLIRINEVRESITALEETWRTMALESGQQDGYALWHQPETTIGELVIDFGSQSYVYMIPPDISNIKISINSNLPIPRAAWVEMLELILAQNGVGVRQLNPFLRQLFFLQQDKSGLKLITDQRSDLELVPRQARIAYVITPEPADLRRIWTFLQRFSNPNSTVLQMVGRDIYIIGYANEVKELLKLYDFAVAHKGDKEYKAVPISMIEAEEMARILAAIFDQLIDEVGPEDQASGPQRTNPIQAAAAAMNQQRLLGAGQSPMAGGGPPGSPYKAKTDIKKYGETSGLKIVPLSTFTQALFLVGTKEEIKKAEEIIKQVESQIGEAREKTIYTYTAKHSDPEELADILQRIYDLMISTGVGFEKQRLPGEAGLAFNNPSTAGAGNVNVAVTEPLRGKGNPYREGFYQEGGYLVNPAPAVPGSPIKPAANRNRMNFLVDVKTGALVMVVEIEILPKLKELIRKLDVPKKMVQVEVLLFERRFNRRSDFGLNLLRITKGSSSNNAGTRFNNISDSAPGSPGLDQLGIFQFFISRLKSSGIPSFDLIYRFLLSQDDVLINSSPSVVTLNMTPATIVINEEISINTGIFEVPTTGDYALKNSFTRAQYGITLQITPTIHMRHNGEPLGPGECLEEDENYENYVTLATDITFDTIQDINSDRPDVTRRHLVNEVSVPEGQSVIIGGLRRRVTTETKESVPFLGELPGVGRLFSNSTMKDEDTEMFLFLTPKIVSDPAQDFDRIRRYETTRRPGDIPEYLCRLYEARQLAKNRILDNTMRAFFGHEPERCAIDQYQFEQLDPFEQLQQYRVRGPGIPPNPVINLNCGSGQPPAFPTGDSVQNAPYECNPADFQLNGVLVDPTSLSGEPLYGN